MLETPTLLCWLLAILMISLCTWMLMMSIAECVASGPGSHFCTTSRLDSGLQIGIMCSLQLCILLLIAAHAVQAAWGLKHELLWLDRVMQGLKALRGTTCSPRCEPEPESPPPRRSAPGTLAGAATGSRSPHCESLRARHAAHISQGVTAQAQILAPEAHDSRASRRGPQAHLQSYESLPIRHRYSTAA